MRLDSVQIGVSNPEEGCRLYNLLLGGSPCCTANGSLRYQLPIGAIELVPCATAPGIVSLSFMHSGERPDLGIESAMIRFVPHFEATPALNTGFEAIDHVVIHTSTPEAAIALWRDRLGLRLALDRSFPERGMRLIFFRSGGITLEISSPLDCGEDSKVDQFYGLAYRVDDLAKQVERLEHAGVDVSPIRKGFKQGTQVATVRSGTASVPTLLIEDPSRRRQATD